jgi:large subunit ribosomal protein L6
MSRVAKKPIPVPESLKIIIANGEIVIEGKNGTLRLALDSAVKISHEDGLLSFSPTTESAWALAGTLRAVINNMIQGVTVGYERKLQLVGVGYKAKVEGKFLDLSLGLSHPVRYPIPDGIVIETPTQTEIKISGMDKRLVGQVAANVRDYRKPEPYKGKGVRYVASAGYSPEDIILKEVKKK